MSDDGVSWKTILAMGGLYLAWRTLTDAPPVESREVPEDIDWMDELVAWAYLQGGVEGARRMMAMQAESREPLPKSLEEWIEKNGLEGFES
jgi:hypothetical protein